MWIVGLASEMVEHWTVENSLSSHKRHRFMITVWYHQCVATHWHTRTQIAASFLHRKGHRSIMVWKFLLIIKSVPIKLCDIKLWSGKSIFAIFPWLLILPKEILQLYALRRGRETANKFEFIFLISHIYCECSDIVLAFTIRNLPNYPAIHTVHHFNMIYIKWLLSICCKFLLLVLGSIAMHIGSSTHNRHKGNKKWFVVYATKVDSVCLALHVVINWYFIPLFYLPKLF